MLEWLWKVVPYPFPTPESSQAVGIDGAGKTVEEYGAADPQSNEIGTAAYDHGVKEAEKQNQSENASEWPLGGWLDENFIPLTQSC